MKITGLYYKLAPSWSNNSKSTFNTKHNNNKVNRFNIKSNSIEYAKNLKKSKSKKMSKSQNLIKLRKKLFKKRNVSNFNITKTRLRFLTSNIKIFFYYL